MKSITANEGSEITLTENTFTKKGYTFAEWNTIEDGSGKVYADKEKIKLTSNTTLYAKWTANNYTVTFDKNANDATDDAPAEIKATYDVEFKLPENTFTKIGYNFAGWNTKADGSGTDYESNATVKNLTAENGETILYAKWVERETHKINYVLNDGSHIGTQKEQFKETEDVTLGTAEKTGYTFGGWYEAEDFSGTAVTSWKAGGKTEDVTLYAQWTANTYTVKFDANGGSGDAPAEIQATYDVEFELPENTFAKIGYNFAGWNTKADGSGTRYEANTKVKNLTAENNATVTLYAKWDDRGTHKISYELNGGNHIDSPTTTFKETEDVTLGTAERTGYTFIGWYEAEDFSGTAVASWNAGEKTEDVTLYAKWKENTYKAKFDKNANDATGDAPAEVQATYDVEFELPENKFTRTGYNFAGWNTKADGSGKDYEAKANVKNLTAENNATVTLYAKWEAINYTIKYELDGGTNATGNPENYTIEDSITLKEPTKDGFTFVCWYSDRSKKTEIAKGSIGDIVLQAVWKNDADFVKVPAVSIKGSETWTPESEVFVSGRKLEIKAFWMSDHEVTRAEWKAVMETTPSNMSKAYDKDGNELTGDEADNNPVNYVNWYDAIVYCNERSEKEGLTPCYTVNGSTDSDKLRSEDVTCDFTANGYRLPTEAEWEWAARGGGDNTFYAGSNGIDEVAWNKDNTNRTGTREVKTKKANGYGLYDMSGNVWEWCWDWGDDNISSSTPDAGASSGKYSRCPRGGSWNNYNCDVACRGFDGPDYRGDDYGLRVVRTAQ